MHQIIVLHLKVCKVVLYANYVSKKMVLGKLDKHMQNNEIGSLPFHLEYKF